MIRDLIYYDNPILRKKCVPVTKVTEEIRALVSDMIETMDTNNGIGLAASQVGELWQIFIIRPFVKSKTNEDVLGEVEVYINPKFSSPSAKRQIFTEGCLSLPGLHVDIERPEKIHIDAMDLDGKNISKDVEGFAAVEMMHENDHLHGVLFIDRLSPNDKKEIATDLKRIKEKYSS